MTRYFILAILMLGLLAQPALAETTDSKQPAPPTRRCPAYLTEGHRDHALESVTVYNGPPSDQAELLPDVDGWNLQDYEYSGHELYLVCHYKTTDSVERYMIPRSMKTCKLDNRNIICQ